MRLQTSWKIKYFKISNINAKLVQLLAYFGVGSTFFILISVSFYVGIRYYYFFFISKKMGQNQESEASFDG